MAQWFRLYESVLDDPKVQRLKPDVFKAWINMLALASRHDGILPEVIDIGFALRVSQEKAAEWVTTLLAGGLLERIDDDCHRFHGHYVPHNWASRQYKSDGSAERMRRHRDRHRNADGDVTVTPSESDTEQIQSRTDKIPRQARKTKLPDDWQPSEELLAYAAEQGCPDPKDTAERFRLHHQSKGTMGANWSLGFQYWCRNEKNFKRPEQKRFNAPVSTAEEPWEQRHRAFREHGFWLPMWGPKPKLEAA